MINPLSAPRVVWCRLRTCDTTRLDRLALRVNANVTLEHEITRNEVVRALVRKGLDLARTRQFTAECLQIEPTIKIVYRVSAEEFGQLTRLQGAYQKELPGTALPPLPSIQRALVCLAMGECETRAIFPTFVHDLLESRLPRKASRRGRQGGITSDPDSTPGRR